MSEPPTDDNLLAMTTKTEEQPPPVPSDQIQEENLNQPESNENCTKKKKRKKKKFKGGRKMLKLDGFSKMVSCLADPPQRSRAAADLTSTLDGEEPSHSAGAIGPETGLEIDRAPEEYSEPSVALPFVGLANSMSGGRKGEKVMELLTEQGIPNFDLLRLTKDEDYFEEFAECLAAMFAKVFALGKMRPDLRRLHLRILICGGDGTMSWGLSTLDRAMLHQRVIDIFSQDEEYIENLDYLLVSGKPKSKHVLGKVATTALIKDQFLDQSGNVLGGDVERARRLGTSSGTGSTSGADSLGDLTGDHLKSGADGESTLPPIEIVPLPPSPLNDHVSSAPAAVTTFNEAEQGRLTKSAEEVVSTDTLDVVDAVVADLMSPSPPVTPAPSATSPESAARSVVSAPALIQDTGASMGSRSSSSGERGSAESEAAVSTPMIDRPKTIPLAPASIDALSFYQTDPVGHKTVTLLEESEESEKTDGFRKSGDGELVPEKHMVRLLGQSKSAAKLLSVTDEVSTDDDASSGRASSVPSMPGRQVSVSMSELIIQRAMSLWRNKKSTKPDGVVSQQSVEEWTIKTSVESDNLTIHTAPREDRKGSKGHRSAGAKGRGRSRSKDRRMRPGMSHLSSSQSRRFVTAELGRSTVGPEEEEDDLTQTLNAPFGYGDSDDSDSEQSSSAGAELSMADHELITRERQDAAATSTQIISDLNRKMLSAMYATRYAPAFIPVPLGTGNDFSRSTGHGNLYPGSSNIPALLAQLCKPERPLTRVDRWGIKFMNTKGEVLKRQTTEMLCYFSVGYTALITKRFQEAREKFPAIHDRPWKNKFAYVHIGARTGIEEVTGFHRTMNSLVTMYVDGRKVRLPKRCRSVVINNISSMADGVNFWGSAKSQGKDLKSYSEPSLGDGLLEVMASKGLYKYLQMKMGMSHYRRLAQASHIVFDVEDDLYVQLDGEAWQEGRGRIEISLLHQLPAVIGTRSKPLGPYVLA